MIAPTEPNPPNWHHDCHGAAPAPTLQQTTDRERVGVGHLHLVPDVLPLLRQVAQLGLQPVDLLQVVGEHVLQLVRRVVSDGREGRTRYER